MKVFASVLVVLMTVLTDVAAAERLLRVKYRATPVDVDTPQFEALDTSRSSWIRGAWYDAENKYMLIDLEGTVYHYCGLDGATWNRFKSAESLGREYHASLKGNFDCRVHPVPQYGE